MSLDLVVKGNLVLEEGILEFGQVGVKDGTIVGLYTDGESVTARETIDARGLLVFPGIVDAHVHSYSHPNEGFEHSTTAAAAGGVTTIVEMPYDVTGKITNVEIFQKKIDRINQMARVDVALLATLEKEGSTDMIAPLVEMGACGFKLSVNEADPVRFPRIADGILWNVLPVIAEQRVTVGFHAENEDIINFLVNRYHNEGKTYPKAHCESRPPVSETTAVLTLLEFAFWTRCRLHLYHISHPRTIDLIEHFRQKGLDVSVETCPHYLVLHEGDMERLGAYAKSNPPLRKAEEVEELWLLVKKGNVDIVASDHAPWPFDRKKFAVIFENSSGAPGVQTIFPLLYSEGVHKRKMAPLQLSKLLSTNPARRFNLYPRKGHIALGADADFAILDQSQQWIIRADDMFSSAGWTPYDGMAVQGKIFKTILRGQVIYDGREVIGHTSYGRFVPALRGKSALC